MSEPAQAAWRRIDGTRIGREPGPPTCEKGCVRQFRPWARLDRRLAADTADVRDGELFATAL
ncbi:hypothetical protein ACWDE9_32750, partial [Streptomyces olivaceoviridis]